LLIGKNLLQSAEINIEDYTDSEFIKESWDFKTKLVDLEKEKYFEENKEEYGDL
jgi:hypothetical protein